MKEKSKERGRMYITNVFSRVVKKIVRFQPDIISLVEVDYVQFFFFFLFQEE